MKYSQEFRTHLLRSGFPQHWIDSAISYRQLKKCIKRVEAELTAIGLDQATLQLLLERVNERAKAGPETASAAGADDHKPFEYRFLNGSGNLVEPKLLFLVDEETGNPLDATLSPETKNYLHQLALSEQLTAVRIADDVTTDPSRSSSISSESSSLRHDGTRPTREIEVPLTNDLEFFSILQGELSNLAKIQDKERARLTGEITAVGIELGAATAPDDKKSRKDVQKWQQLFQLYLESAIFFATNEQDHGVHSVAQAQAAYAKFLKTAQEHKLLSEYKQRSSAHALQHFLSINTTLLHYLQFQQINQTAMTKILKKFDKRTALNAKTAFPTALPPFLLAGDMSKALAAQLSTDILSSIPLPDNYLCPICFTIAHRPIRLACQHIFCIRCMIIMQRQRKTACPLCREDVVMMADVSNLDEDLQAFQQKWFPELVKQKQKANTRALGFDNRYNAQGCMAIEDPTYEACVVM